MVGHGTIGTDGVAGGGFPEVPGSGDGEGVVVAGGTLCVVSPAALVVIGVGGPIVVAGGVEVVGAVCAGAAVGAAVLGTEVCRGAAAGGTAPARLV